jgi:outer membrane protein assembly factor BamA
MRLAAASLVLFIAATAHAEDGAPLPTPPAPAWAADRAKVPDAATKVDGGFPDALPLIGYDTNLGLEVGAGAHYTIDGSRADPLFAYTPYRHRFYAQGLFTTGGYQQHILSYDGFYVADTPYRLRAVLTYERNTNANYFGNGAATLANLSYRGTPYSTYDAATNAAGSKYFHYGYDRPQGQVVLERSFLGGRLRGLYGLNVQHADITRYDAPGSPTKLGLDCTAGLAAGCSGGWNNTLRAGVSYDTRDFDPDPNSGFFVDATGQWSAKGFGSSANSVRLTMAARAYVSPFPKLADLVIAGRVLYSIQSAGVPFFAMDTLAMAGSVDDATDQQGLGGERTLRGYRQDRFIGLVAATANLEVRWTFVRFVLLKQHFSFQIAPFVDTGRVYDRVDLSLSDWKPDVGAGLRIGWNHSTVIMVDYGVSSEDSGLFIDWGMMF